MATIEKVALTNKLDIYIHGLKIPTIKFSFIAKKCIKTHCYKQKIS